jgi:hypothetical protein
MHGRGVYRFADDTEYEGGWLEGKRSGFGETKYSDGSKYVGEWLDGYYHGKGTFTYGNGTTYEVYFHTHIASHRLFFSFFGF